MRADARVRRRNNEWIRQETKALVDSLGSYRKVTALARRPCPELHQLMWGGSGCLPLGSSVEGAAGAAEGQGESMYRSVYEDSYN